MTYAKKLGLITRPVRLEKQTEEESPFKRLLTRSEIDCLIELSQVEGTFKNEGEVVHYHAQNGKQLSLFIGFLTASGCREQEALQVQKGDVDMKQGRLTIRGETTKSGKSRSINFNPALKSSLQEIMASLPPDTVWLFPSPRRGTNDRHANTFRQSFNMVREIADMPEIGFHHFRHYFASTCVMAGVDYMTIASWLGHQDGGVLIGKIYGKLNDSHKVKAAAKLKL
jgi:integrase